jgi:hypothetical protein
LSVTGKKTLSTKASDIKKSKKLWESSLIMLGLPSLAEQKVFMTNFFERVKSVVAGSFVGFWITRECGSRSPYII